MRLRRGTGHGESGKLAAHDQGKAGESQHLKPYRRSLPGAGIAMVHPAASAARASGA